MINIIQSWTFLESVLPGELPSLKKEIEGFHFKDRQLRKRIIPIFWGSKLWKEVQPANIEKYEFRFRYYIDCYERYKLNQFLRDYFQSQEELINKESNLCFSFSFDVNEKGEYVSESLFIPHVQLIMKDIVTKASIQYETFKDRFNSAKQRLEETAQTLLINKVNTESINKLCAAFYEYFHSFNQYIPYENTSYTEILMKKRGAEESNGNFNSFYIDDLQQIFDKGLNATLQQFIEGKALEIDINENSEMIQQMLLPNNLPLGKWPSPIKHRLSLMQQIAVNHIVNGNERIISVNGPPGTGKTTLLKDVFAELIVERALLMSNYDDPQNAFIPIGKLDINSYEYRMYKLDEKIAQYSMVVASSNNGAVENISKDLPKLGEIVRADGDDYDRIYAMEVEGLDLFPDISSELVGGENTWGLFSAALGKSSNITSVSKALNGFRRDENKTKQSSLSEKLQQKLPKDVWRIAVSEFDTLRKSIELKKAELNEFATLMLGVETLISERNQITNEVNKKGNKQQKTNIEIDAVNKQKILVKEQLENLPQPSIWEKFIRLFVKKMSAEEKKLRQQINELIEKQRRLETQNTHHSRELKHLNLNLQKLNERLAQVEERKSRYQGQGLVLPTKEFWEIEMYEERQKSVLWQTDELNFKRSLLFLKALKIQKIFLMINSKFIKSTLTMFSNRNSINLNIDENKKFVENMWNVMHLVLPVMSTTFASFSSMYRGIGKDFIGYLFIDEAGQASPQQAAGALWRSKKAIVVGDPIQIEPVVTLDETILHDIRKAFQVSKEYIGTTASVQVLADLANPIGAEISRGEDKIRIGIPLWVHRRCLNPMFSIANEIAYNNKMVLANKEDGKGKWYPSKGNASQAQYVHEQGEFIVKCFQKHLEENAGELPNLFVITPFTAVKDGLKDILKKNFSKKIRNFGDWVDKSVGTVHTFQGKEAKIVYFVTGTDNDTDGAAEWSCQKPNLLNVAVTRAKEEFYVVGDLERFKSKTYYEDIIRIFKRKESLVLNK
ncbi:DEAD/DEAH box helicase [Bacillus toyonensis]|uniref:DEAD/DEAH box helicase n=1 Tax=Bacillus toyonensis TaxID=155322 RepID=UPI001C0B1871|nr:DEAD/DEAH box helicase [Bacillus toyonensis]MBU4642496.1 ATP-binding protein [Bacillus toyonensis]